MRRANEPLRRVHIHLSQRDLDRIEAAFASKIRRSEAIRILINAMLDHLDAAISQNAHPVPIPDKARLGASAPIGAQR